MWCLSLLSHTNSHSLCSLLRLFHDCSCFLPHDYICWTIFASTLYSQVRQKAILFCSKLALSVTPSGVTKGVLGVAIYSLCSPSPPSGLGLVVVLPVITMWQIILWESGRPFTALLVSMSPVWSNFHLAVIPPALALCLSLLGACTSIIHQVKWGTVNGGRKTHG